MQITQPGGLQTVSVDGVTITGNGTPASPLVGAGATPAGWPLTWFEKGGYGNSTGKAFANPINTLTLSGIYLPAPVHCAKLILYIPNTDGAGLYDAGFYTAAGALACHIGAQAMPSSAIQAFNWTGGVLTLNPGRYYFATTGNSITASWLVTTSGINTIQFYQAANFGTSTSGVLPSTITPPADSLVIGTPPTFALSI
jgi:hypothetical protein